MVRTATLPPSWAAPDWDHPGVLSIVLQGGLFDSNAAETAAYCLHWRELFPTAEVILSISSSNILNLAQARQQPCRLALTSAFRNNSQVADSISLIVKACDNVVYSGEAVALPPIKTDTPKLNNANFQIMAAKAGLFVATGAYILRIRSDLVFLDRSFLRTYEEGQFYRRGNFAVFAERLLISQFFTINPFTIERMPFHYSDWFHLGPAAAVRDYWDTPPMPLKDAVHFAAHEHRKGSYASERLFNTRLAVEQHIAFACFSRHFPSLTLAQHNDLTHVEEAMGILRDNFIVCDVAAANGVMPKYDFEMRAHKQRLVCVTQSDWKRLAAAPEIPASLVLVDKILHAEAPDKFDADRSFPRLYTANMLKTKIGVLLKGNLVAREANGVVVFGPHATLNAGNYVVRVHAATLVGDGKIQLAVTSEHGATTHAERTFHVKGSSSPKLEVVFQIERDSTRDVECVVTLDGVRECAVSAVEFEDLDEDDSFKAMEITPEALRAKGSKLVAGELVATTVNGLLFHGPYATIQGGSYVADYKVTSAKGSGVLVFKVTLGDGENTLAERRVDVRDGRFDATSVKFNISGSVGRHLETLCFTEGVSDVRIAGVTVTSASQSHGDKSVPSFSVGGGMSDIVRGLLDRLVRAR